MERVSEDVLFKFVISSMERNTNIKLMRILYGCFVAVRRESWTTMCSPATIVERGGNPKFSPFAIGELQIQATRIDEDED